MMFRITRASNTQWTPPSPIEGAVRLAVPGDEGGDWYVEVPDLAALMALIDRAGTDLIVSNETITIYDGYVE